ncbi:MAG TPA: hypothetical protein VKH83_14510 [Methylomirabilota bacterium]|nr:hypothetical protein [Methylomirabilota bacterium]
MTTIRPITAVALAWTISATPTMAAAPCPAVDSARAMLSRAAAEQNERDLKQAQPQPQKPADQKPADKKPTDKKSSAEKPDDKSAQARPTIEPAPISAEMQRAALLVKEADDACQAGKTAEANDKAKAAMALMGR